MSDQNQPQRRAYFRLRYPEADRPTMTINGQDYPVIEISEGGAKIRLPQADAMAVGTIIVGGLLFRDGVVVPVKGEVIRIDTLAAALKFSQGISFGRVQAEQRRLLREHPAWFREPGT